MTGTLTMKTSGTGQYDQGIRINRVNTSSWALILIGKSGDATSGTGTTTAGDGAWLIGTPASSNSLVFNLNTAGESVGLCLKGHGASDMKWNNNTVWHAGNDGSGSGLDADLLDGRHLTQIPYLYNYGVAGLGNTSNVTVNDLATYYASTGMIYPATDNPTGAAGWVHVWSQTWQALNTSWVSQIALGTQAGVGMWYRTTSGTAIGCVWRRVWDNANAGTSTTPWSASSLTLAGSISGATSISASGNISTSAQLRVYTNSSSTYGYIKEVDRTANTARLILGSCWGYNSEVDAVTIENGNVGIGIGATSPSAKCHIAGGNLIVQSRAGQEYLTISSSDVTIYYNGYDSDGWCHHRFQSNGTTILSVIGTGGTKGIDVQGVVVSTGDQVISSDINLKTHFKDITLTSEQIANAPAVSFDWKDGHGHSFGSIAQYWKPLVPEAVLGEEGSYTLAYGQLGVVLGINNGKAIFKLEQHETEQDKEIKALKNRVRELENEVKRLRS